MNTGKSAASVSSIYRRSTTIDAHVGAVWRSKNSAWQESLSQLLRYARQGAVPILLEGLSGTGKTRMAREIHAASPREKKPFRELTLSSLEDSLVGSDLFGHVAGAFTDARQTRTGAFISASGGTLFLDEIGKASERVQMKLLGSVEGGVVVQQGSDREVRVDVRIISATNVSLDELVRTGRFLPDLAARLGLFRISIPPLSDRREDIGDLAREIVSRRAESFGYEQSPAFEDELLSALERADWPLNIRQLDAALQLILMEAASSGALVLTLDHCPGSVQTILYPGERKSTRALTVDEVQSELQPSESRAALARRLGISEATLYRRLRAEEERKQHN